MNKRIHLMALTLIITMVLGAGLSFAADPLEVAPDMYKLKQENERVRVMEVTFQPGQSIPEHSHPDHFVYVVEGGQLNITKADGTENPVDLKPGDVLWMSAESHRAVNTGSSIVRLLVTELKDSKQA